MKNHRSSHHQRPSHPAKGTVHFSKLSGIKKTNLNSFDPAFSAIETAYTRYRHRIEGPQKHNPSVIAEKAHPGFLMPVTARDVVRTLRHIPRMYLDGLCAVILLGGSKKQEKAFGLSRYGSYWKNAVFLHAFPLSYMESYYETSMKPSYLAEYRKAGARIVQEQRGITIQHTVHSLKRYYLLNVLLHEIGHHLFIRQKRTGNEERFVDNFAELLTKKIPK